MLKDEHYVHFCSDSIFPTTLDQPIWWSIDFPANSDFHFHVLKLLGICSIATSINCYALLHVKVATTIR